MNFKSRLGNGHGGADMASRYVSPQGEAKVLPLRDLMFWPNQQRLNAARYAGNQS